MNVALSRASRSEDEPRKSAYTIDPELFNEDAYVTPPSARIILPDEEVPPVSAEGPIVPSEPERDRLMWWLLRLGAACSILLALVLAIYQVVHHDSGKDLGSRAINPKDTPRTP